VQSFVFVHFKVHSSRWTRLEILLISHIVRVVRLANKRISSRTATKAQAQQTPDRITVFRDALAPRRYARRYFFDTGPEEPESEG